MRAVIVGTGPSLTPEAIRLVNNSSLPRFGCNLAFRDVKLDAFYANNKAFWHYYGDEVIQHDFDMWTYEKEVSLKYGVRHIEGKWAPGLSTDPNYIHWGHGSGYELLGIAYHYGVREFVLIGYDLKYNSDYDGFKKQAGGDRHYFGEYPPELQHWTKYNIGPNGELNGLLELYRTIEGVRIINCSPGSALDFFEVGDLEQSI